MAMRYRIGIDIGGTFTDLVLAGADGTAWTRKVPTTPGDEGRAIVAAIEGALTEAGAAPVAVERVVHATTVATNAILERKGARTGLVTTEGFRDVLELRRLRIPEMYSLNYARTAPLVPRRLRREVRERMGADGRPRVALDEDSARAAAERLAREGVAAVAVSFLHAYANAAHEARMVEILRAVLGSDVFITASSELLPVIREYERTSTTVINAYLGPAMRGYFDSLTRHLRALGIAAPVQIMKSDGGIVSLDAAAARPAWIVESGPAAGVIGAAKAVRRRAAPVDCITLDMGGTTAKAAIVEAGRVAKSADYEVGAGINLSSKLIMGGGYALKLPVLDISEIGAGGGSLVRLDAGGLLRVGPESAGADPGPVAYARGGTMPTFTDALIVLGYLNPRHLVGGALSLDAAAARRVLEELIARPLGKDLLDAAFGVYQVACGTMVRAVKAVSTYRGRDPRDFALFAFGGNGPVVGAEIARQLDMDEVRVPPDPGVFSAHGLLVSDVEHEASRAYFRRLDAIAPADLAGAFAALGADVSDAMAADGYESCSYELDHLAELRYAGQAHELAIACADPAAPDFAAMAEAFSAEHARTYGHRAEAEEVECVTLRVIGRVETAAGIAPASRPDGQTSAERAAFFGPGHGVVPTPVIGRHALDKAPRAGPLIVEEYDSTCVVPPGWAAAREADGTIRITRAY